MPTSVTMPQLGESVTEGTITRWLKSKGDRVEADEPLVEVSTDKVDTEIVAPASGVLLEIRVAEDETAVVGAEIAVIGGPDPAADREPVTASPVSSATPDAGASIDAPAAPRPPVGTYVTPLVRKLAGELGVDLATLRGSGVGGRLRKADVIAAAGDSTAGRPAAGRTPAPSPGAGPATRTRASIAPDSGASGGRRVAMSRTRRVIASRMLESLQASAQLTAVVEVDATSIARLRAQAKDAFARREGVKLTFLPFFGVAALEALQDFPAFNASVDPDGKTMIYHDSRHLGIAVDSERGLVVPVIRNAGDLTLAALAREIADVAARTRANNITPDELGGGTFTITNLGSAGILFDTPIINHPQAAILFTGAIVKRPVVVDDPQLGEIFAARSMCYLGVTYDHRIIDGADAGRFLNAIKNRIEGAAFATALGLG
jgi:pyruvate dehydrogenase E2 component (dihydrolipoamide acetyltransferase)